MAGIKIRVDAETQSGAAQVQRDFDKMADGAAKTVAAIDRLQKQLEATATALTSYGSRVASSAAASKSAETSFLSLGGAVTSLNTKLTGLISLAAAKQFVSLTRGALESASAIVDTADKIGIGVEQLQELQFAATQSGVSVETFNNALTGFTVRLQEAAEGTGAAKDALKSLGLDAKALAQDPAAAVGKVADKIAALTTQAERLEKTDAIFTRAGRGLVNLLQVGGPAIDDLRQKARDLGIVLSDDVARSSRRIGR